MNKIETLGSVKLIIEKLSEISHEQWVEWSKNIVLTEKISSDRQERWKKLWIPYNELSDLDKEYYRIYSYKILDFFLS